MVEELFKSYGAAQDDNVFRFASDVYADQTTEIERMQKMLDACRLPRVAARRRRLSLQLVTQVPSTEFTS